MRQFLILLVAALIASSTAFSPSAFTGTQIAAPKSTTSMKMFFGAGKDDGSPGDYVCKVSASNWNHLFGWNLKILTYARKMSCQFVRGFVFFSRCHGI